MEPNADPSKFYNEHDSDAKARVKINALRIQYLEEIDYWKNKYLSMFVPSDVQLKTILEVGCGPGHIIGRFPIATPLNHRYGIDTSLLNIEFARNAYPELNFYAGTFEEFIKHQQPNIEIDMIILSDVLEHVTNDVELLKTAGNYAKYVLVNIPMEKCWRTRYRNYGLDDVSGHFRAYNLKDVQKLIADAELTIINSTVEYYCKQAVYKKHLKEQLFQDRSLFKLLTKRIPRYIVLSCLVDNILYRWVNTSNFFGLLSKLVKG